MSSRITLDPFLFFRYMRHDRKDISQWDPEEDAAWREMLSIANDGIISSAAIIQGLLSGGATGQEATIGVLALIGIGMVGSGASQFNEASSERASQIHIMKGEQAALAAAPEVELNELIALYQKKGLPHELSVQVATALTENDALKAQLDAEYDLEEIPSATWPWKKAIAAALVFLFGSLLPLLFLLILPWGVRGEVTLASVMVALAISGWLGHLVEHSEPWRSMLRTMMVGAMILGISSLAGSLVKF